MLEPTLSDVVFLRSVKKFFLDITTPQGIPTFFDFIDAQPTNTGAFPESWISVIMRSANLGTLSDHLMYLHLFVKNDQDNEKMSILRDFMLENLVDLSQTDGRKRVPFYDVSWNVLFTGVLDPKQEIEFDRFDDGTKMKTLPIKIYWGAK